ncbi:nickel/cobalt transporter [Streptomyces sp. NPDC003483]
MNGVSGYESHLIALFDSRGVFWVALVVALGVGALHAVAPGHGKTVTAAYLVGVRGRHRDALRLGVIVAVMHTLSVLVLATTWVALTGAAGQGTKTVTTWMQAATGLVVVLVGGHLTYRQLRRRGAGHTHTHAHTHSSRPAEHSAPVPVLAGATRADTDADAAHVHLDEHHHSSTDGPTGDHGHHHGHTHGHGHAHSHDNLDPWSRRGLLALALSGGLLPSPSAFIVLVSGLLTGRSIDAIVLVLAFGIGMAATLTAVGVLTVRGHALVTRHTHTRPLAARIADWIPAAAGVGVSIGGVLYLVAAVSTLTA